MRTGRYATSARRITRDDLIAEREALMRQPPSHDRSEALRRVRSRLKGLAARSPLSGDA
jgi:hypothetical protein